MKRVLFFGLFAVLVAGCGDDDSSDPGSGGNGGSAGSGASGGSGGSAASGGSAGAAGDPCEAQISGSCLRDYTCTDYRDIDAQTIQTLCGDGAASTFPCNTALASGGCDLSGPGYCSIIWDNEDKTTRDQSMQICDLAKGTWLAP